MEDGFDDERPGQRHEHGKAGGRSGLDGVLDMIVRWKGDSTPPPEKQPERLISARNTHHLVSSLFVGDIPTKFRWRND